MIGCQLHGVGCRVPAGYDEAHTDQLVPYTAEQLAARTEAPHRYAYPTHRDYLFGFALWRAYRRDEALTRAEIRACAKGLDSITVAALRAMRGDHR